MDNNNMNFNSGDPNMDNNNMFGQNTNDQGINNQNPYNQNFATNQNNQNMYGNDFTNQNAYNNQGMNNTNPYNQSTNYGQPMFQQTTNSDLEEPVTLGEWIILFLISMVPCVNIIMLFVWAFGSNTKTSKKNYCKASLIITAVILVIYFIVIAIAGASIVGVLNTLYDF